MTTMCVCLYSVGRSDGRRTKSMHESTSIDAPIHCVNPAWLLFGEAEVNRPSPVVRFEHFDAAADLHQESSKEVKFWPIFRGHAVRSPQKARCGLFCMEICFRRWLCSQIMRCDNGLKGRKDGHPGTIMPTLHWNARKLQ